MSTLHTLPPMPADSDSAEGGRGVFAKLGPRPFLCYHCGRWFKAPTKSMSASCTNCHRQVTTQDIEVKALHWGQSLLSCGEVHVTKKARAIGKLVVACHGVRIDGHLEGLVLSGGPVRLGPHATLRGGVVAPGMRVDAGARLEGGPFRVPCQPIGVLDIARITASPSRIKTVDDLDALLARAAGRPT